MNRFGQIYIPSSYENLQREMRSFAASLREAISWSLCDHRDDAVIVRTAHGAVITTLIATDSSKKQWLELRVISCAGALLRHLRWSGDGNVWHDQRSNDSFASHFIVRQLPYWLQPTA